MSVKVYYATILDHDNQPVLSLEYTATAKHSAFLGKQYVDNCPPANTFKIHMHVVDSRVVCQHLNDKRE